jgi:hypothetical protein
VSANASFPEVEGFVVYTSGCLANRADIVGFQMKNSDMKPRRFMDKSLINGGAVLIRGRALAKNLRDPKVGWKYMKSKVIRNFIGYSLLLALPRDWL